ncbi:MAG: hypothetical protein N2Z74_05810, partial [Syntrophales bacterium]|nr:hypothetical protein [Syntrophales bacterium]
MKNHRVFTVVMAGMVCFSLLGTPLYAHGPQAVILKYEPATTSLSVTVTHTPFQGDRHFISEIAVMKNGKSVGKYSYQEQTEGTFTRTYPLAAAPGDVLEARATCNR